MKSITSRLYLSKRPGQVYILYFSDTSINCQRVGNLYNIAPVLSDYHNIKIIAQRRIGPKIKRIDVSNKSFYVKGSNNNADRIPDAGQIIGILIPEGS